jgi:cytochrome c553
VATSLLLKAGDRSPEHIPSIVSWTPETIAAASSGDAFRGMLLAKRCDHCHGAEGFSAVASTPNLAGLNNLAIWKQLKDFQAHKRTSRVMEPIATSLSARDVADVVAYYSALPVFTDPQDNRVFPQTLPESTHSAIASHLITFGDGERGIPPCQSCHGPVAYKTGAPSLATQNVEYISKQLEAFASGARTNDINEPMRTVAGLLTQEESQALAEYYGAGLGLQLSGSVGMK